MKQSLVFNKKWILTASLLAVLGAQYSYQSSSLDVQRASLKNSGEFVFASVSSADQTSASTTEATTVAGCTTCNASAMQAKNLTLQEYTDLVTKIDELTKALAAKPAATTAAAAKETESDCEPASADETRAEKRERLKCEKEEKKQAKLDKEKEKQDILVEKFEDKMEVLKEKCDKDLECLADGFSSELSKYDGKKSLPAATVAKAYASVVSAQLSKDLYSTDPAAREKANAALQSIMQNMPEKYKGLKQEAIKIVQAQTKTAADVVTQEYANSKTLTGRDALVAFAQAKADHENLLYTVNGYSSSVVESLQTAGDNSTLTYYKNSYLPKMNEIMSKVYGGTTETTTSTVDPKNNTRGGRTGDATTTTTTTTGSRGGTTNNSEWTFPSGNQGLTIGNSADQSRGGRGPKTN